MTRRYSPAVVWAALECGGKAAPGGRDTALASGGAGPVRVADRRSAPTLGAATSWGAATCFTLVELIVVMMLLGTLAALAAPRLTGFFRGRRLDSEARRLWALTRYAREEAITRAVPVKVWLDPATRRYGVAAVPGYGETFPDLTWEFAADVQVAAEPPATGELTLTWWADGTLAEGSASAWTVSEPGNAEASWRLACQPPWSVFALTREQR